MIADTLIILTIIGIFLYALYKRVDAYNSFMNGIKDGLYLFVQVYPTMLAMCFAIFLLRSSKVLEYISFVVSLFFKNIPFEIIPMVLFRPFSGSATLAILVDIFQNSGVDSFAGIMGSIIQGSTDTTLYVISLYFAHVGVTNIKNSLKIGLIADVAGIGMAILLSFLFFS